MKTYEAWEVDAMMATARAEGVREGRRNALVEARGLMSDVQARLQWVGNVMREQAVFQVIDDLCAAEREASA